MLRWILVVALLASPALSINAEKRRAFYRKTTTTSTAAPVVEDNSSSESKFTDNKGEGLYTVADSFIIGGGSSSSSPGDSVGKGSVFKPITSSGDKLTSFSEYNFGSTKLSEPNDSGSDEDYVINLKNIKPLKPSSNSNSYKPSGSFDFLNNDFSKSSLDSKTKSSFTNKFSISHPTPTKSSVTGKLDHLDDSTEYEIYSSLKSANSYKSSPKNSRQTILPLGTFSGTSLNFDGKVKKLPSYSFDDSALASYTSNKNKKNKLSLDDDTFGGGSSFGLNSNFGVGLLGKPEKQSSSLYGIDSEESGFGSSNFKPFGKGSSGSSSSSFKNTFNLDSSEESEEIFSKPKFPKLHSSYGTKLKSHNTEYESDFDVKNIKLPGALTKFRPNTFTKPSQHKNKQHGSDIDNPNPLEFRPNFKLQDVPNLYPDDHIGAGIAAKGQIENFLNAEHSFRNEPIRTTHFLDGHPGKKGQYQQFLKSQEDEQFEKEALKAQIEYLKAQAAKRPSEGRQRPSGPPISIKHGPVPPRGRPVRRIPPLGPLGAKQSRPPARIPHYNDRPYSISFKL
ncbi:uncharacterized protein LOC135712484 isoform X2 [Ochlerotatus camptorhynchus]|uniref:uncharacterized protein LOC135712484 isoform X2 n=1 Tax=Ochlerotatus camptorhynchus TaxID=644619 RepID=UPI0031DF989B